MKWIPANENWEDAILYGKHLRMIESKEPVPYRAVAKSESFGNKWLRCWCSPYDIESIPAEQVEYFDESPKPDTDGKEQDYWKKRCEAAEVMVNGMEDFFEGHTTHHEHFRIWQQLKTNHT